ncbi:MAG: hypothetical protein GY863_10000, partial [bacterium]|nr:hypothetical protein [bacterium]
MEEQEKTTTKDEIAELLLSGDLKIVKEKMASANFVDAEILKMAENAYRQLVNEKKIERALVIYSEFQFSKDLVQEFIRDKFNLFNEDKCFIEAFLIGR